MVDCMRDRIVYSHPAVPGLKLTSVLPKKTAYAQHRTHKRINVGVKF